MADEKDRPSRFVSEDDDVVVVAPSGEVLNPEVYERYAKAGVLPDGLEKARLPDEDGQE